MKTPADIAELSQRIEKAKEKASGKKEVSQARVWFGAAFRTAIEFISPVIVGCCLGYVLDMFFAIKPICLIILGILGCVAGVRNLYRMAQSMEKEIKE